jgi:hypothetical protein
MRGNHDLRRRGGGIDRRLICGRGISAECGRRAGQRQGASRECGSGKEASAGHGHAVIVFPKGLVSALVRYVML